MEDRTRAELLLFQISNGVHKQLIKEEFELSGTLYTVYNFITRHSFTTNDLDVARKVYNNW